ncbi:MAG: tetratricopeptide repeat protein [Nitrospinota bacterium]
MKVCLFLALATFAVYFPILDHDFINYDDPEYITENLRVQEGLTLKSIFWAFTTLETSNWHPLTWISHVLDYQLYGSDPSGHHLTSLIIHIANALLLFFVFNRMTGEYSKSIVVATLFALHPFNVESVAWISERKNVLSTFFWLLTMAVYIEYLKRKKLKFYFLVLLFFLMGLMSKPMLVTLPFVLLLMDYWPLQRLGFKNSQNDPSIQGTPFVRLIVEKSPLFLLTIASCLMTLLTQKLGGAMEGNEHFSLIARLNNAMVSYISYLGKTFWPTGLSVLYPHPGEELELWKGTVSAFFLLSISLLVLKLTKVRPYLSFCWFWYLGTLFPVIGLVQVGAQAMADRYTYVPLIGIFCMVAWGIPDLLSKLSNEKKLATLLFGLIVITLSIMTWNQAWHWKNSITLFKHAINVTEKKYPHFDLAYNNLGAALFLEGNTKEAILNFKEAIKLRQEYPDAHYNLGVTLLSEKKAGEAIPHFKKAVELKPNYPLAYNNLGNAFVAEKKMKEAITQFEKAIKLQGDFYAPHFNIAKTYLKLGQKGKAVFNFKRAHHLQPGFSEASFELGTLYYLDSEFNEAFKWFNLSAERGNVSAKFNLGLMYVQGQGVPKDFTLAHMWWNLAGDKESTSNIKKVEKFMSSDQIKNAKKLAMEWQENHRGN